jgi:TIR domain
MTKAKPSVVQSVFISHARADAPRLERIVKTLIENGVINRETRILKEEDLPAGNRARREDVKRTIQSASKVVVVWGDASAGSQWVNYEIGLADALGKPIIAVLPYGREIALPPNLPKVQIVRIADDT